jgi:hypothetical protein
MLAVLLKCKNFCDKWAVSNLALLLCDEDWNVISELALTLEPSKKAMTKLQSESVVLTDCRKIWDLCHIETAEIGTFV